MKQSASEEDEAAKFAASSAAAAAAADAVPIGRCLFPPVDRRQNRKDLRRLLRRIEDAQTIRWNFDFIECRPLEGRFQWKKKPDDRRGDDDDDDGGLSTAASQIPDLPGHSVVPRCPAAVGCRMPGEDDGGEKRRRQSALSSSSSVSTGTTASSRVSPSSSSSSSTSESRKTPGPTTAPGRRQSTLCRYYRVKKRRPERVK